MDTGGEVELALARENREQREILFPIRLDDASFTVRQVWQHHFEKPAISATSMVGKTMGPTNRHSPRCCDILKSPRHQLCSVILIYFWVFGLFYLCGGSDRCVNGKMATIILAKAN
jgi:hypothetical protein